MSASNSTNAGITDSHSIKLYTARFRKFFTFLHAQGIDSRFLESSFETLVKSASESQSDISDVLWVSSEQYGEFFQSYQKYLNETSLTTQQRVNAYILAQSQLLK